MKHLDRTKEGKMKELDDLRMQIKKEIKFIDIKPYSHNIVNLLLGMINKEYGQEETNKAIEDFELEDLGWSKRV